MDPVKKPARSKTMTDLELPGEALQKKLTASANVSLDQLREERERVEQYTKEQFARLSRLRELLREEKAAAEQEIAERRQELEQRIQQPGNEQFCKQIETLEQDILELAALRDQALAQRAEEQAQREKLQVERDSAREQFRALVQQGDHETLRRQIRDLQQKLMALGKERDDALTAAARERDDAVTQLGKERDDLAAQLQEARSFKSEADVLRQQVAGAEQQVTLTAELLKQITRERDEIKGEVDESRQQLDLARQELSRLRQQKVKEADAQANLAGQPKPSEDEAKSTQYGLPEWLDPDSEKGDQELLRRQVREMQKKLTSTQAQLDRLRDQRQELQDLKAVRDLALIQVQQLVKELAKQNAQEVELKPLADKVAHLEQQAQERQRELDKQTAERRGIEDKLARLEQQQAQERQQEIEAHSAALREEAEKLARTEQQLQDRQQELGKQATIRRTLEMKVSQLDRRLHAQQKPPPAPPAPLTPIVDPGPLAEKIARLERQVQIRDLEIEQIREECSQQEEEMVAERRRLKEEQRQLAEDSKTLLVRERALREQIALLAAANPDDMHPDTKS